MLVDAHCHPFDLFRFFPDAEKERRFLGVMCASSAATLPEFEYSEELSRRAKTGNAPPLLPCFAVHPQMCALWKKTSRNVEREIDGGLALLEMLAGQGRLAAIGETGFDLYSFEYRETEKVQDTLFAAHIAAALRYDLPLVLHIRRAMHKVFAHASELKKCRALVFHSWSGTAGEGDALIRRGLNAFFSFGTTIMLNHREAMRCCAVFPAKRLLVETDSPYQPLRGKQFSAWGDLPRIVETAAALRREAGMEASNAAELEETIRTNFRAAFGQ
jgi:TatD DNase family protein